MAIRPQFSGAKTFSEGLAPVSKGNKWGYIDQSEKVVINFEFEKAEPFSEGLAEVWIGNKYGYIDKTGKYIWKPTE
jgi:hypothetical protein